MNGVTTIFLNFLAFLPFKLLYLFSDFLYLVLYYLPGYRQKVVETNLKNSFPDKSDTEIKLISKKYYHFLADMTVESVKMLNISADTIRKRFRLNNPEEIQRHLKRGKAVIAVTGHYGNWEWGSLILSASIQEPVLIVYKPLTNKTFEQRLNRMRSKFGAILVPMKNTLRKIVELKNKPFVTVLVSDQTPARSEAHYFTEFLNQPTAVFLGIEKISKLTDGPVVYCHINRYKRGFYECTFQTLFDHPTQTRDKEITEAHTKVLNQIIQQKPELWLWSHKRWKLKP